MSKAKLLFDLIIYVNAMRSFSAADVAREFGISVRTAHRYLAELSEMGIPLYTEPGRNGGYRILNNRVLPPILFNENEAFAIFFAFQTLKYFKSLPFEIDMKSVSRKLYAYLPPDTRKKIDRLDSVLTMWSKTRGVPSPFLKEIIEAALENFALDMLYQSKHKNAKRKVVPIGVYAHDGFWYMPAVDLSCDEIRVFRLDRILELKIIEQKHNPGIRLDRWLENLTTLEPRDPIYFYAELTREGMRRCISQPWLEPHVKVTDEDHGYVEMYMDRNEIAYVSNFFLQLGTHAKVIKPQEVIDLICRQLRDTLQHYSASINSRRFPDSD